jgi:hypothetical protein
MHTRKVDVLDQLPAKGAVFGALGVEMPKMGAQVLEILVEVQLVEVPRRRQ